MVWQKPQRDSRRCDILLLRFELKMVLSSDIGGPDMTRFSTPQDRSFPYVLVCSTLGTIISLAISIMTTMPTTRLVIPGGKG